MKKTKIIFVHLLNDFSGSPKVLNAVINAIAPTNRNTKLYIGGGSGDGFLSGCGIPITRFWYKRMEHRILTLFTYFFSQVVLFCKLLCDRSIDKNAIIYVNTLLPFGAAWYGRLTGRKVIYHVHEISITPVPLKMFLMAVARLTSSLNLYVSHIHMQTLPIPNVSAKCIYNALDIDFISIAKKSIYKHRHDGVFNALMISSLRDYKGIPELLDLAIRLIKHDNLKFQLVVNDDQAAIEKYFIGKSIPKNLIVYPRAMDTTQYYGKASLVMNLSRVDQWVETFGLTILEAMAFGIPVIVPPVGGPVEMVEDGINGLLVDSYDLDTLEKKVMQLMNDKELCEKMSLACRKRAMEFSPAIFADNIRSTLSEI